ncbi:MAG TPA: flotillin family protein [Candidatus Angelobacter sp.]|nr:flotillin family protein [Candidatus Angelobacter sp.]
MQGTATVWVIVGLCFVVIVLLAGTFACLFRKAGPHEALVVYGFRGTRIVVGRGTVVLPMVESFKLLSLELMPFDVAPQQDLYTAQGVAIRVEAVAQVKVKSDPFSIRTAAEQFLTKTQVQREELIRLLMEGHLQGIIGELTVEQIVKESKMIGDRMRSMCADDMSEMGLEVILFAIKIKEADHDTTIKRAEARK